MFFLQNLLFINSAWQSCLWLLSINLVLSDGYCFPSSLIEFHSWHCYIKSNWGCGGKACISINSLMLFVELYNTDVTYIQSPKASIFLCDLEGDNNLLFVVFLPLLLSFIHIIASSHMISSYPDFLILSGLHFLLWYKLVNYFIDSKP